MPVFLAKVTMMGSFRSRAENVKLQTLLTALVTCLQKFNVPVDALASAEYPGKVVVLVPTCNAGAQWAEFLAALLAQRPAPHACVVIDSESSDGCDRAAQAAGLTVVRVERSSFNHGKTRQWAIDRFACDAQFVIFLTQDAILAEPQSLYQLLRSFDDPAVAAAYGRQLPHTDATALAAHARLFNYPDESHTSRLSDVPVRGIKTCFLSNSFAAYRVSALKEVGGFASDLILGEDTQIAARLIQAGHAIRYHADALVYHSHNYSFAAEFRRYFDTGVFHAQQIDLLSGFGEAGREGFRFVWSEVKYLSKHAPLLLPQALTRTFIKFLAYRLGRKQAWLPVSICRQMSMTRGYWA